MRHRPEFSELVVIEAREATMAIPWPPPASKTKSTLRAMTLYPARHNHFVATGTTLRLYGPATRANDGAPGGTRGFLHLKDFSNPWQFPLFRFHGDDNGRWCRGARAGCAISHNPGTKLVARRSVRRWTPRTGQTNAAPDTWLSLSFFDWPHGPLSPKGQRG